MVADINTMFCRTMLGGVHAEVKKHFPDVKLKAAWVYKTGRQDWEFHGPDDFYWYGEADNAYDARSKGWLSWLRKMGVDEEPS